MFGSFFLALILAMGVDLSLPLPALATPTVYTVTSSTDTGAGSGTSGDILYCLTQAAANPGSTIAFQDAFSTFTLTSALPAINVNTTFQDGEWDTITGSGVSPILSLTGGTVSIGSYGTFQGSAGTSAVGSSNDGSIGNGNAGNGGAGGNGGIGGLAEMTMSISGSSVSLINAGTIAGGTGGSGVGGTGIGGESNFGLGGTGGTGGHGGTGGTGAVGITISNNSFNLTNNGTLSGGTGGAGDGGAADGGYTNVGTGGTGGAGGNAGTGGAGAIGITISGNSVVLINSQTISGGTGGSANGGSANGGGTNAGLGGNGGNGGTGGTGSTGAVGIVILGNSVSLSNSGTISGGAGGSANGGSANGGQGASGNGGNGGTGGHGGTGGAAAAAITVSNTLFSLTNTGTISGGNGGTANGGTANAGGTYWGSSGGNAGTSGGNGTGGAGAVAISFTAGSAIIINSGTISGGQANGGTGAQADAIDFTGSGNELEIEAGSTINGNVVVQSAGSNNSLVLGGTSNGTFNASHIGVQYQNFDAFLKTGTSTWTLSGTPTGATPWAINQGILEVSSQGNLGSAGLTLSGGELLTSANATLTNSVTLEPGVTNSLAAVTGTTATYSGIIADGTGSGALTIGDATGSDNGTVILSGANSYSGGTTILAGSILEAENNSALGASTGAVTVSSGASLQLTGGVTLNNNISISGTGMGGAGAIFVNNASLDTVGGNVTLAGNALMNSSAGELYLNGSVNLGTNDLTFEGNGIAKLNGQVTGAGGITVDENHGGSLYLAGSIANTYTGLTTVAGLNVGNYLFLAKSANTVAIAGDLDINGGIVCDTSTGQLAATSTVTLTNGGTFDFIYGSASSSETIAGLNGASGTSINNYLSYSASLTLGGSGIYAFAGQITNTVNGALSLTKQGAGTQTLSGINTYTGGTTISAGTLVAANANALGTGLVTQSGGTLETDNVNHVITLGNGFNQTGGLLVLNLNGTPSQTANNDQVNVTGTATLNGNLKINYTAGALAPFQSEKYTVITTTAGITSVNSAGYEPPALQAGALLIMISGEEINTNHDFEVTLTGKQTAFTAMSGTNFTTNQQNTASYLDRFDASVSSGPMVPLLQSLDGMSLNTAALGPAFEQLTSLNFAQFTSSTSFNNASFMTQQFDDYLANHRGADGTFISSAGSIDCSGLTLNDPNVDSGLQMVHSRLLAWTPAPSTGLLSDAPASSLGGVDMKDTKQMISSGKPSKPWSVFISGDVVLAQEFSDPTTGVPHADTTTGAVQLGADYKVTPHFVVGALFGYGHTDATLDTLGSTASVDTYSPGVYASYSNGGWYANALGSYGFSSYDQDRKVSIDTFDGTAHSSPSGDQIVGNLDGGYDFHRGHWTFGPTLGAQYVHLDVNSYTETDLPGADLNVNKDESDSLRSRLGGRVSYAVQDGEMTFTPHLNASWQHEFLDSIRSISDQFDGVGAGSFSVYTVKSSPDSALADVGLDAQIDKRWTVFTDYTVQAGQANYFGQSVQAGVKIGF